MNITFHTLTLQNFLSYGNNETVINLNFNCPTLIFGLNYDAIKDGEIDSNGAGKTTILNGIMYAMYGKPLSDIKVTKLINNINNKDLEVSLIFEIDKVFYKVIRFRRNKNRGGDGVILLTSDTLDFKKSKDITPDSIINTNKKIVDISGIPYEICARIIVFSGTYDAFLSLPLSHDSKENQKDIIEELFDLTILTKKAKKLKLKLKDENSELVSLISLNEQLINEKSRYDEQLINAVKRVDDWNDKQSYDIVQLEAKKKILDKINFKKEEGLLLKIEDNAREIKEINVDIIQHKKELNSCKNTISLSVKWDTDKKTKLNKLKKEIKQYKHIDFELNFELFELLDKIEGDVYNTEHDMDKLTNNVSNTLDNISNLGRERHILDTSKCPYCSQQYDDAKDKLDIVLTNIEDLTNVVNNDETKLNKKKKKFKKLKNSITEIKSELEFNSVIELERILSKYARNKKDLKNLKKEDNPYLIGTSIKKIQNTIESISNNIEKCTIALTDLNDCELASDYSNLSELYELRNEHSVIESTLSNLRNMVNPHTGTVNELSCIKLDDSKVNEINKLSDEIGHGKFLLKLLSKKDSFIRKALLNKNIPFLNARLHIYLTKLGLPHKVEFKHDMSTRISQFDNEIDFGNLSSGQKARINLALAFAFRDVLQSSHSKVNFCILDECLDVGLSNVGVRMAAKMLKSIAIDEGLSMFIISHRDSITSMFDSSITIKLKGGFSTIEEE